MGEDIRQSSWLTADEQVIFIGWLGLDAEAHSLDVACGSGGPTLRIAQQTGCQVTSVDIQKQSIAQATTYAVQQGLADRAPFRVLDGADVPTLRRFTRRSIDLTKALEIAAKVG